MQCAFSVLYIGPMYLHWTFFLKIIQFFRDITWARFTYCIWDVNLQFMKIISLFRVAANYQDMLQVAG